MKPTTTEVITLNSLAQETKIIGNIDSKGDIRLDGDLEGNLDCSSRVIVGPDSTVRGTITCKRAEIFGKIEGDLNVEELLSLKNSAVILGNIKIGKLSIEPGAQFEGQCAMITTGENKTETSWNESN